MITCLVSGGIAYFATTFNIDFVKTFILASLAQLAIWQVINHFSNIKLKQIIQKGQEIEAMQFLPVPCAGCKTSNVVSVRLDDTNTFKCNNCKKSNAVYIDISTAMTTDPINLEIDTIIKADE
jgi:hypothetical protein|tara:strand:- start:500 stop:868 length:369 start_codon:yes stop_codon:yes gene_type:complete